MLDECRSSVDERLSGVCRRTYPDVQLGSYTPDEAFFDLVRSKLVAGAMLAEIGGKAVADANVSATAKVQKGIIRDYVSGANEREQVTGWLPAYFRFPAESYTPSGAGRLSANAAKAAQIATPAEK